MVGGRGCDEVETRGRAPRFCRRTPDRAAAEVVDVHRAGSLGELVGRVRRTTDRYVRSDDRPRHVDGKIVLPEMQYRSAGRAGDIGAVVDGEQRTVALRGGCEHLQRRHLGPGLETLLAELDDVDAAHEHGVEKLGEITLVRTRVHTEVKPRLAESAGGHAPDDTERMPACDVAVLGAGMIGTAVAWRCAQRGQRVVVVDPDPAAGAWRTAAGMLAPTTEFHATEPELLALGLDSLARFSGFVADLGAETGHDVGYRRSGSLVVAWDGADLRVLRDLHLLGGERGLNTSLVTGREVRGLEPALAPGLPGALLTAADHSVDPRALRAALRTACAARGVEFAVSHSAVLVDASGSRVRGIRLADGRELATRHVVVAAGAWSAHIPGLPREVVVPVRPVKGQTLLLRGREHPLLSRIVRGLVKGSPIYLVPRADNRLVIGASTEENGFDLEPRAGAVYELLRDAQAIVPEIGEAVLEEVSTGLRPGTPDNMPLVGAAGPDGLLLATGHYRNGILLAPITADGIAATIAEGAPPGYLRACAPARFAPVPA